MIPLFSEPVSYSDPAASVVRRPSVRPSSVVRKLLDLNMCARRFLRIRLVECYKTWYNTCIVSVVDARLFIF